MIVVRCKGGKVAVVVRWQFGKARSAVRWQGRKDGRVVRCQGFIQRWGTQGWDLFVFDANQRNEEAGIVQESFA